MAVQSKMLRTVTKQQILMQVPKQSAEATAVCMARNNVILVFFRIIDVKLALLPQAAIVPCAVIAVPYVCTIEATCILKESPEPCV